MRLVAAFLTLFAMLAGAQDGPPRLPFSQVRLAALDRYTVVALRDGTVFRGQIWKADKLTGELHFLGRPERKVACAEVETITAESFERQFGRDSLGLAVGLSTFFGGLVLASKSAYPGLTVSAASPMIGWWAQRKSVPRKARTFAIECPQ